MGKNNFRSVATGFILTWILICSLSVDLKADSKYWGRIDRKRECVKAVYYSEVGVRERTGRNDGREVTGYLNSVGLTSGYAWCAAFVHWCLKQCGISSPITAWSPTAVNPDKMIYSKKRWVAPFKTATVFTLYYNSKGRIGHTGFADEMVSDGMLQTVEGNTNSGGSRDGDGVYIRFRPIRTIYTISDFIK